MMGKCTSYSTIYYGSLAIINARISPPLLWERGPGGEDGYSLFNIKLTEKVKTVGASQQKNRMKNKHQWLKILVATSIAGVSLQTQNLLLAITQYRATGNNIIINNSVGAEYKDTDNKPTNSTSNTVTTNLNVLKDPFGRVTGCAGEILPDYNGFTVGLYGTSDGFNINGLTPLTGTEVPDIPGNALPLGIAPNIQNSNPFFLTNNDQGTYNFLLDPDRGQLDTGKTYILIVNPPASNSSFSQRRIRMVLGQRQGDVVPYTATSLDGKAISATDGSLSFNGTLNISNAERVGLSLAVLNLSSSVCVAQEIKITKTGDRASAEPGDIVIYRLAIRNLANSSVNNVTVTDTLPTGLSLVNNSVKAEFNGQTVNITTTKNASTITFTTDAGFTLPQATGTTQQSLNIVYAALISPDGMRGNGENSANVNGKTVTNLRDVKDGPAIHRLRIQPGILSDCGTIIGRVFVDKNFDGEQQPNEPGIPNAVIYLDDGNRILTDANGLFSITNVLNGYRTGVLDLTSLPGYALAPNLYFKERNGQSRLVHLAPGGLVRMNFAVTPTFQEEKGAGK